MSEPSLLDVFNQVFTGRRVLRAALILIGLYLLYRALQDALTATWAWAGIAALGALIVLGLLGFLERTRPSPPSTAVGLPGWQWPASTAGERGVTPWSGLGLWRAARLSVSLAVAFVAQQQLYDRPDQYWIGLALWSVALGLWYPALRAPALTPAAAVSDENRIAWNWAFGGLGLGLVSYWLAGNHLYTFPLMATWLSGVAVTVLAFSGWRPAPATWPPRALAWLQQFDPSAVRLRLSGVTLAVLAILALGTGLRYYQLNEVPREMTSDHVEKLLDVRDVLNGQYSIFFPRNTGREPLQFYYTAALINLFNLPLSHLALKIGTALAGSATLVFVFLLARELGGTEVGLWAMLLSALTRWPIALSRAGLRYPFAPLFAAPALYFFFRGLKSRRRLDFVWAGVFTGIGLHGYTSYRVMPIVLAVLGGLWLLWTWRTEGEAGRRTLLLNGLALGLVTLVICLPLLRYMVDRPDLFWYRVMTRLSTTEQPLPGQPLALLGQNLFNVFLMFNFTRDQVWTVNISSQPILSPLPAALFGLGFVTLLVRALRRDRWAAMTLAAWFLMLLPSGLSLAFPNENPSVARAGIAFPLVMIMAAIALTLIRRAVAQHWPSLAGRAAAVAVAVAVVGLVAQRELPDYYITFRDQYARSATNPAEVGQVVRAFVAGGVSPNNVWLKGYPFWLDTRSVALESFDNLDWNNSVLEVNDLARAGTGPEARLFIVHIWDQPAIAWLRQTYPGGRLTLHHSPTEGKDFLTFFVPGTDDLDEKTLPPPP